MQSVEKFMLHHYPKLSKVPKPIRSKLFKSIGALFHEKEIKMAGGESGLHLFTAYLLFTNP